MAKDMRNSAILLLLCNIAFFIAQFHFGDTTTNPSSYSNNTNQTCIESERRALLEFKGNLVDRGANRLASRTAGEDCCNWAGITCNPRTGHVHKLHLRNPIQLIYWDEHTSNSDSYLNNSLGGQINPSILNLEHLTYLDLSSNYFSWIQIPTFLGSLKNLRYLNLSDAGFRGEISSHVGNLSNLQYRKMGDAVHALKRVPCIKFPKRHPVPSGGCSERNWRVKKKLKRLLYSSTEMFSKTAAET